MTVRKIITTDTEKSRDFSRLPCLSQTIAFRTAHLAIDPVQTAVDRFLCHQTFRCGQTRGFHNSPLLCQ